MMMLRYDDAIEEYKKAKEVGENAEINAKIIECQYRIQKREEKIFVATLTNLKSELQDAEKSQDYNRAIELCEKLMDVDMNNHLKWKEKRLQYDTKQEQSKKHREKVEKLRKDINSASFNENWDKVILLCDKVLSIEEDIEILEIKNKAITEKTAKKKKQEFEKRRRRFEQKIEEAKKKIGDGKLDLATTLVNSIEKEYPEETVVVKSLRKEIFNKEDNNQQLEKTSKRTAREQSERKSERRDRKMVRIFRNG